MPYKKIRTAEVPKKIYEGERCAMPAKYSCSFIIIINYYYCHNYLFTKLILFLFFPRETIMFLLYPLTMKLPSGRVRPAAFVLAEEARWQASDGDSAVCIYCLSD
jgi:hypothetical protein